MNIEFMISIQKQFDDIANLIPDSKVEFWFARDLMGPLGYQRWDNFELVIRKAIRSCITTGDDPDDHFRDVTKMVTIGSSTERKRRYPKISMKGVWMMRGLGE